MVVMGGGAVACLCLSLCCFVRGQLRKAKEHHEKQEALLGLDTSLILTTKRRGAPPPAPEPKSSKRERDAKAAASPKKKHKYGPHPSFSL